MELIRISDSKLKIMLSESDMRHYEIDAATLDYENSDTRRAVRRILADAREGSGFDVACDRLLIQFYPSRDGGCEVYVTKMQEEEREKKTEKKPPAAPRRPAVFSFSEMGELLSLCRHLHTLGYREESDAYIGEDGMLYLFLMESKGGAQPYFPPPLYHAGDEYGMRQDPGRARYIKEHATLIAHRTAVSRLAALV